MEKKDRVFVVSVINIKFVIDPFPKTKATPESVYLNLHTNND